MVTNMISQLQESFPLRRAAGSFEISFTKWLRGAKMVQLPVTFSRWAAKFSHRYFFPNLLAHSFLWVSLEDTCVGFPTHGVCWNRFLSKSFVIFDPLPPIRDQDRISPYNIKQTISNCHSSNLNGLYLNGSQVSYANGVNWLSFRGYRYSLKRTEMKVRTKA